MLLDCQTCRSLSRLAVVQLRVQLAARRPWCRCAAAPAAPAPAAIRVCQGWPDLRELSRLPADVRCQAWLWQEIDRQALTHAPSWPAAHTKPCILQPLGTNPAAAVCQACCHGKDTLMCADCSARRLVTPARCLSPDTCLSSGRLTLCSRCSIWAARRSPSGMSSMPPKSSSSLSKPGGGCAAGAACLPRVGASAAAAAGGCAAGHVRSVVGSCRTSVHAAAAPDAGARSWLHPWVHISPGPQDRQRGSGCAARAWQAAAGTGAHRRRLPPGQ